ncbi:iron-containing alcohol dehydrogenase family protein [Pontibacillus salicampi]|uniref:Iron-containing alcohol dehydrogenase family protein n=1 Tax=Pontibacillus salicampi TaxID=1449801 RepID=A0ABV6LQP5_9BACI
MSSFTLPKHLELGADSIQELGRLVQELQGEHIFVIMDSFLASSTMQYKKKIQNIAKENSLQCTVFSDYQGEPTTDHVKAALNRLNKVGADCVIAIGGGSTIDLGKAVAVFGYSQDTSYGDIPFQLKVQRLPLLTIPSTAGTGSEATKVMVITDSITSIKMNPGHKDLVPDGAILDPNLSKSLPKSITAYTGLDALTHAMEAYVSNRANEVSDHFAITAMKLIGEALPRAYEEAEDMEARTNMLLGSWYAGIAFSNSSTNLAHAAGRALGANFHVPHGLSVALLLPYVMEFGLEVATDRYAKIATVLGEENHHDKTYLANSAVVRIKQFNDRFHIFEDGLKFINIEELEANISNLADKALSGNGIQTNRKIPTKQDVEDVFVALLEKLKETKLVRTSR